MSMENKSDYTFYRETVEEFAGRAITDREWEVMAREIESAFDFYLEQELPRLWGDIEFLVTEADKLNK